MWRRDRKVGRDGCYDHFQVHFWLVTMLFTGHDLSVAYLDRYLKAVGKFKEKLMVSHLGGLIPCCVEDIIQHLAFR